MISTKTTEDTEKKMTQEGMLTAQVAALFKGHSAIVVCKVAAYFMFDALEKMSANNCAERLLGVEALVLNLYKKRFGGYLNEQ